LKIIDFQKAANPTAKITVFREKQDFQKAANPTAKTLFLEKNYRSISMGSEAVT
jgi:hypothetical protein